MEGLRIIWNKPVLSEFFYLFLHFLLTTGFSSLIHVFINDSVYVVSLSVFFVVIASGKQLFIEP